MCQPIEYINIPTGYNTNVYLVYLQNTGTKLMLDFKNRIKQLRIQKSLTQDQAAQRLWVTKSTISAYEMGTKYPSLDMLIKLAAMYNVTTDYLLGVDKKRQIDITGMTPKQVEIINILIDELKKDRS